LNGSLNTLDEWTEKTREILRWTAIGCIGSFLTKFAVQWYRRVTCHFDKVFKDVGDALERIGDESNQQQDDCRVCIESHESNKAEILKKFNKKENIQNLVSDK